MYHPILYYGRNTDIAMLNVDGLVLAPMWLHKTNLVPGAFWKERNAKHGKLLSTYGAAATFKRAYGGVEVLYTRNRGGHWQIDRMIKWHLDNEAAIKMDPSRAKDPSLYKHSTTRSAQTPPAYIARLLQVGATYDDGRFVGGEEIHSKVFAAWDAAKVREYFLALDKKFQSMRAAPGGTTNSQAPAHQRWGSAYMTHFSDSTAAMDTHMSTITNDQE